jgi:dephospho-CoA kinase
MYIIGITGNFGSGKTQAAKILAEKFNAIIIDVDKIGHQLLKNKSVIKQISNKFGFEVLSRHGGISRKKLGEIIFQNERRLNQLNKIMHPLMVQEVRKILERLKKHKLIVIDCALLFEMGLDKYADCIWLIRSSLKKVYERLHKKGFSYKEILQRRKYQKGFKINLSKISKVISNNGNLFHLNKIIIDFFNDLVLG